MKYTVVVYPGVLTGEVEQYLPCERKGSAIKQAKEWAAEYPDKLVYIEFYRSHDNQHGYINPDGSSSITGRSWTC